MIDLNESRGAQCDVLLTLKTQDQTLMRQTMDGVDYKISCRVPEGAKCGILCKGAGHGRNVSVR